MGSRGRKLWRNILITAKKSPKKVIEVGGFAKFLRAPETIEAEVGHIL